MQKGNKMNEQSGENSLPYDNENSRNYPQIPNSTPYNLNTAYTLYLLLGFFSAHRFYLGRIVSAIFQMLGGFGFFIWSTFIIAAFMLSTPYVIEFINSINPDSYLNDIGKDELIKPIALFALPNLIYLVWIISDFFRLETMVNEANAQKGVYSENLQPNSFEAQNKISSAKTLIYIGCGILILMAVLGLFDIEIQALKFSQIIGYVCCAVGIWFVADTMRSRTLMRNVIILNIIELLNIIPFMMIFLGDKSAVYLALMAIFTILIVIYEMFIYKEFFDCSGKKIFIQAFFGNTIII